MKNKKLKFSVVATAVAGVTLSVATMFFNNKTSYTPRELSTNLTQSQGIKGAIEYYNHLRKNPITGEIDFKAMIESENSVKDFIAANSRSAGSLTWEEMGPDNVGGRTRAFLIDPTNPSRMFAGGVAGGLWVSNNGGGTWEKVNDQQDNLTVTWITRAPNGDIYYSTGEGFADPYGANTNSGNIGQGVFKSVDGGQSFQQLASTKPSTSNASNDTWAIVNKIEAHPTNSSIVYAGTQNGLRVSTDGGNIWENDYITNAIGNPNTGEVQDIQIHSDGTVLIVIGRVVYVSNDGSKGSFVNNTPKNGASFITSNVSRIECDIAPTNSSIFYAAAANSNGRLYNIYYGVYDRNSQTTTWSIIGPGSNDVFDPFWNNGESYGQGGYDNIIKINPFDADEIILGGIQLWRWKKASNTTSIGGQWFRTGAEFPDHPANLYYVHSDKHNVVWHPTDKNIVYVTSDGGVSRSLDGGYTHRPMNKNYNVYQCYSVAFSGFGEVLAGSQDNGTQYINFKGNSTKAATEIGGGDGGHCEISQIDRNVLFSTVYYGALSRTKGDGGSGGGAFGTAALDSIIEKNKASFVTPIELWESFDDPNSPDSIWFKNKRVNYTFTMLGNGNKKDFSDVLTFPQASAKIQPGSVVVTSGSEVLTDAGGLGNIVNNGGTTVGSINYTSGAISVVFTNAVANQGPIDASYDVYYDAGSPLYLHSKTANFAGTKLLPIQLNPGDSIQFQDKVQAKLAIGLSGSVWISKRALDFGEDAAWIRVATVSGTVQHMSFTSDGNTLFVGTTGGGIYRISNLSVLTDQDATPKATAGTSSTIPVVSQLSSPVSGRALTDISVDPNNNDHLMVTVGGYGSTSSYIYRSVNATSSNPSFSSRQGNLPKMPIYSAVVEKRDNKKVIIGTEYGVFSTDDITVSSPQWVSENNGFSLVPVYMLRQQRHDNWNENNIYNDGYIYAGTHGRGIWRSNSFAGPVSIKEIASNKNANVSTLKISPNPMADYGNLSLSLVNSIDLATLIVFDMNGKVVKEVKLQNLSKGNQNIQINVSDLRIGTYFVKVSGAELDLNSKMMIVR